MPIQVAKGLFYYFSDFTMNSLQTWHTMNNKLSVVYMLQKFLDDYRILDCNLQRVSLEHLSDGKVP